MNNTDVVNNNTATSGNIFDTVGQETHGDTSTAAGLYRALNAFALLIAMINSSQIAVANEQIVLNNQAQGISDDTNTILSDDITTLQTDSDAYAAAKNDTDRQKAENQEQIDQQKMQQDQTEQNALMQSQQTGVKTWEQLASENGQATNLMLQMIQAILQAQQALTQMVNTRN